MKNFKITMVALLLLAFTNATAQSINSSRSYRIANPYTNDILTYAIAGLSANSIRYDSSRGNTLRATNTDTGVPAEQWNFTSTGNGYYIITNMFRVFERVNGRFEPVATLSIDGRGSRSEGSSLFNNVSNITDSQQWKLTSAGRGNFIITNKATGLAITRDGNVLVSQKRNVGSNDQKWFLEDFGSGRGFTPDIETGPQDIEFELVSLFPNPARVGGVINARIKTNKSGTLRITIRNVRTSGFNTISVDVNEGETTVPVTLENLITFRGKYLPRGTYSFTAEFGSSVGRQTFLIQ